MATSTIKYNGCSINGVRVTPGNNYTSYDLKFGRYSDVSVAVGSSSSPKTANNGVDTKLYETGALPAGTYMIMSNITVVNTTNNGTGYRRTRLHYEYTDGSESAYNIGIQLKTTPSGYVCYLQDGYEFWTFSKEVKLSVWLLQNSGQQVSCYGYFKYQRI